MERAVLSEQAPITGPAPTRIDAPDLLSAALQPVMDFCVRCGLCQEDCAFLQRHGTPGAIAERLTGADPTELRISFECSLCGLCTAVCPHGVDAAGMLLELRRAATNRRCDAASDQCVYLGYETRGTSRHLSYYGLPPGCDTVFFPGCTLPATRPAVTRNLFDYLRVRIPSVGMVLDCCTKPSHDLGRQAFFEAMFFEMRNYLLDKGVRRVLVACPSCYRIFDRYGGDLTVQTVYELLNENDLPRTGLQTPVFALHDPCAFRLEPEIQSTVRELVRRMGGRMEEMAHRRGRTLCCGEGGSVGCTVPEFQETWRRKRSAEARGLPVLTYCAGCVQSLSEQGPALHLLDLLFSPQGVGSEGSNRTRFPLTCINRVGLKNHIRKSLPAAAFRERTFALPRPGSLWSRNRIAEIVSKGVARLFFWYRP